MAMAAGAIRAGVVTLLPEEGLDGRGSGLGVPRSSGVQRRRTTRSGRQKKQRPGVDGI